MTNSDKLRREALEEIRRLENELSALCHDLTDMANKLASEIEAHTATLRQASAEPPLDALDLAIIFHHTYERLALNMGYDTRKETRVFDPESANGKLMIAVCAELLPKLYLHPPAAQPAPATTWTDEMLAENNRLAASIHGKFAQPAPVNKWCSWCRTATHSDAECHATRQVPTYECPIHYPQWCSCPAPTNEKAESGKVSKRLQRDYKELVCDGSRQIIEPNPLSNTPDKRTAAAQDSQSEALGTRGGINPEVSPPAPAAATTGAWGPLAGSQSESPASSVSAAAILNMLKEWHRSAIGDGIDGRELKRLVMKTEKLLFTTQEPKA